jgi:hypothetical protein
MDKNSIWISFRSRAEELECFDIIDIINDLEDDMELKNLFQERLLSIENSIKTEQEKSLSVEKLSKKQIIMNTLNIKSQTCVLF